METKTTYTNTEKNLSIHKMLIEIMGKNFMAYAINFISPNIVGFLLSKYNLTLEDFWNRYEEILYDLCSIRAYEVMINMLESKDYYKLDEHELFHDVDNLINDKYHSETEGLKLHYSAFGKTVEILTVEVMGK